MHYKVSSQMVILCSNASVTINPFYYDFALHNHIVHPSYIFPLLPFFAHPRYNVNTLFTGRTMSKFTAQVKSFTTDAKHSTGKVFSRAIAKLEEGVKKNIRQDTNNMGRSVVVSTTSMPQVDTELRDDYPEISFTVLPSHVGKPVWIGVQAVYAPRWEFGFVGEDSLGRNYNQAGDYTFQKEGAKWVQYVKEAEAELM